MINLRQEQELNSPDVSPERKQFIRYVIAQDKEVDGVLTDMVSSSDDLIATYSRRDQINNTMTLAAHYTRLFQALGASLIAVYMKWNGQAALLQGNFYREKVLGLYGDSTSLLVLNAIDKVDNLATAYPEHVQSSLLGRKFAEDARTVGEQITSLQGESLKVVKNIIVVGIQNGRGATEIAKDIQEYIKPSDPLNYTSPFKYIKEKYKKSKVALLSNGRVPAGSIETNAVSIARTEINNTYRDAVIRLNKGMPWVNGYDWNLSPSHPKADVCDSWAHDGPYTEKNIPKEHPRGMCYITVDFVDPKELL